MTDRYLLVPLELTHKISLTALMVLSQLAYQKKHFTDLYASNAFFANLFNCSLSTVQRAIRELIQLNYITVTIIDNYKRYITVSDDVLSLYGLSTNRTHQTVTTSDKLPEALQTFFASWNK